MSFTGKVQNGVVVLPPGAHLADGTEVEVTPVVSEAEAAEFTEQVLRIAQKVQNLSPDLASNHDHYLHGHPRK